MVFLVNLVTFHLLALAIHDNRTSTACKLLEDISPSTIKKKKPIDTNSCFLHAMANGLEAVCLILYEKGFPSNVNLPAVSATISVQSLSNNLKTKMTSISALGGNEPFMFPSYFMMAVGVGLDNVVRAMMKVF